MREKAEYRCEAASVASFVEHLAVSYVRRGYVFYVTGLVPAEKNPRDIDRKMIAKYGITASKFTRSRRKRAGFPNAHYLRHGRFWVLLATIGHQHFFAEEDKAVRDARKTPIKYEGYAVGFYEGKPSVRIDRGTELNLKAYFADIATKRTAATLEKQFRGLPFRPYEGTVKQLRSILRDVNEARRAAKLELVPSSAVRWYRSPMKAFAASEEEVGKR